MDDAIHVLAQRIGKVPPRLIHGMPANLPVQVRFRRGDRWQTARARGLTRDGVYLSTAIPPAPGATVAIHIAVGASKLIANASVLHVTPPEVGGALGARGFGVRFHLRTPEQVTEMENLLLAARGTDLVSPAAPPRRRESRYPVHLPLLLWTAKTSAEVSVLDVSRHGLFVNLPEPPANDQFGISLPVDGEKEPVQAGVRVARQIDERVAKARGISPGVGLEILSFAPESEPVFQRFVERISRRVDRSILIGAMPNRLVPLCEALTSCGYDAAGATDPRGLLERATGGVRAPDLVVLDGSLPGAKDQRGPWHALQRHGFRTLLLDDDTPAFFRERVDAMLLPDRKLAAGSPTV